MSAFRSSSLLRTIASLFALSLLSNSALSQEKVVEGKKGDKKEVEMVDLEAARGKLVLSIPKDWEKPKAKTSRILEHELLKPAKAERTEQVRITMMAAGGGVQPNIDRWYTQFTQPDGKSTKDASKVKEMEVDGGKIHRVEIPGNHTMRIGGGPFAPGKEVKLENARMLAAIVELKDMLYFIKLTGPDELVKKETESFDKMLKEIKINL